MVTVHWIKEPTPAKWELKSALIGFTWLNNAHNSKQLGQALFKIIEHVGLEHKINKCVLDCQHSTPFIICCKGVVLLSGGC
jgi:hypothetical protein